MGIQTVIFFFIYKYESLKICNQGISFLSKIMFHQQLMRESDNLEIPVTSLSSAFFNELHSRNVPIKYFFHQQVMRESDNLEIPVTSLSSASRVKKQGHWLLKERSPSEQQLQSMPPIVVGSLKDSGIGTEDQEGFTRSGPNRSSFGMALKVCFRFIM